MQGVHWCCGIDTSGLSLSQAWWQPNDDFSEELPSCSTNNFTGVPPAQETFSTAAAKDIAPGVGSKPVTVETTHAADQPKPATMEGTNIVDQSMSSVTETTNAEAEAALQRAYNSALQSAGGQHLMVTVSHLLRAEEIPEDSEWAAQVCRLATAAAAMISPFAAGYELPSLPPSNVT